MKLYPLSKNFTDRYDSFYDFMTAHYLFEEVKSVRVALDEIEKVTCRDIEDLEVMLVWLGYADEI